MKIIKTILLMKLVFVVSLISLETYSQTPDFSFQISIESSQDDQRFDQVLIMTHRMFWFGKTTIVSFEDFLNNYTLKVDEKYKLFFKRKGFLTQLVIVDAKTDYHWEDLPLHNKLALTLYLILKKKEVDYSSIENKAVAKYHIWDKTGSLEPIYECNIEMKKKIEVFNN